MSRATDLLNCFPSQLYRSCNKKVEGPEPMGQWCVHGQTPVLSCTVGLRVVSYMIFYTQSTWPFSLLIIHQVKGD